LGASAEWGFILAVLASHPTDLHGAPPGDKARLVPYLISRIAGCTLVCI